MAVVIGVIITALGIACVTAISQASHTPLYMIRMEQASSKMSFLPTEMNRFTYAAEKGYTLNYGITGYCGVSPLSTGDTCDPECELTEEGYYTCSNTCPNTCVSTCISTCPSTCDDPTCHTCVGQYTCPETCNTCFQTCPYTCCTCKVCETTEPSCL